MPVVHEYVESPGIYLRARVENEFITYQVSSTAEQLLKDLGHRSGSTVSWALCKQLAAKGYIYTIGAEEQTTDFPDETLQLTPDEEAALNDLNSADPDNPEIQDEEIPSDIRERLESWISSTQRANNLQTVLEGGANPTNHFASIRSFAEAKTPSNFQIEGGQPVYHFDEPCPWMVKDRRHINGKDDFIVAVHQDEKQTHDIRIADGGLRRWGLDVSKATSDHIEIFVSLLPSLFDLLSDLPDYKLDVGNWHFQDGKRVKLDREKTAQIGETLQSLANKFGLSEGHATGMVATKEYAGYGRIRVDEIGATIPFHSRDFSGNRIQQGDQVCFTIELIKYDFHAKEIERT